MAVNNGGKFVSMSLGNLFSKLTKKTAEKKENFLALEVGTETAKAAVWSVAGNKVEVLRLGTIEEWEKSQDLLQAADKAITSASEGVVPEPEKVIFGLPLDWVEGEGITQKKKAILANLCEKLNLKAVGFVVSLEALITYLKMQQGTPPSAIFVQLSETEIVVSLVKLGKVLNTHKVGRSGDLALDIKEGLARFKDVESLPARIILFDGLSDFEEAKQQIISFDWMAQLPFLHFPRVDSLERDFVMKAIAIAGGSEVAKALGFQVQLAKSEADPGEKTKVMEEKEEKEQRGVKQQEKELEEINLEKEEVSAEDLGFVEEVDVKKMFKESEEESEKKLASEQDEEKREKPIIPDRKKPLFGLFFKLFSLSKVLPRFIPRKVFLMLVLPLLAIISLSLFVYFNLLKAQITLYFAPKNIEEKLTVNLDALATSLDYEKLLLPAEELKTESEGEMEINTTGEKLTGEKAQGEVTIYNKTDLAKTFAAGAVLVSDNNLKFALDEEVNIASTSSQERSGGGGEEIIWGKIRGKISAASVGEESNLKAGTSFTFKDYPSSSFTARSEEGLAGGSSKKVKTVTSQDKKQLLDKLTPELEEKGKENLKAQLPPDKVLLDKILETKAVQKKYDQEAGDEADKLKLKLKLSLTGRAFAKEEMNKLLLKQLEDKIPQDFTLTNGNLETEILNTETKEGKTKIDLLVKANLVPVLDTEKIKQELAGKSEEEAKNYLLNLPNLKRAKIDLTPPFIGKFRTLPSLSKNIKIEFQVN